MSIGAAMAGAPMTCGKAARPREQDDFYPTPAEATEAFYEAEAFRMPQRIWEPACGEGHLSKILERRGREVISTDLFDRGYGAGGVDFLATKKPMARAIVTNPPFKLAANFIDHALGTLKVDYLALLLKSTFFHADSRVALYQRYTPYIIYPLTWRLDFMDLGAPTMECSWFVWVGKAPWGVSQYRPIRRPGADPLVEELF